MSSRSERRRARAKGARAGAACVLAALAAAAITHARPALRGRPPLRVCADPNNLPFSNERGEGFENKIAVLVARDLGADLRYTWWAQRRGFVRNTLGAGRCDLLLSRTARVRARCKSPSKSTAEVRRRYWFAAVENKGTVMVARIIPMATTIRSSGRVKPV